jgi:UDP-N-acetylglucosamine--N-acetylmuramyl-(pentapeptide) pyrophosphoryl-undecaprenol N-acetylglucosamine transferase
MRFPRLLFYAVNGLGLGHVTRLLSIARKVRDIEPHCEIVFLTSSEADNVIYREGFAAFKIPSRNIRLSSGIRPVTYARMVQTVTMNLVASLHPHLLVVDTFPAGMIQELLPCLRWDLRKAFVYREQRLSVAADPVFQNTLKLYDLCIVPHLKNDVEMILPEGLEIVWAGPIIIRDNTETLSREEGRKRIGAPSDIPLLYVTFGGGGDTEADEIREKIIPHLAGLDTPLGKLHLAVTNGPLHRGEIPRGPYILPIFEYPIAEIYPAFDGAISAAGYNTVMELMHHKIPSILIPFERHVDDQGLRAKWALEHNAAILTDINNREELIHAALKILDPKVAQSLCRNAGELVPENGAMNAAQAIIRLLD